MVLDADNRVVFANQALSDIFSIPLAEINGKRLLEAVRLVELSELVEEVRREGCTKQKEMRIFFPSEKILLGTANLLELDGGKGVSVVISDISEIRKLENLRQEFVANVSHELKTPLTAIKSCVETLLYGAIDDPQNNRKFLEKIEKNTANLSSLIDDILELSRLETYRKPAPFETFCLEEEVDRAIETLSDKIGEKQIEVIKIIKPGSCEIVGDPRHIYRALLNLLDNAIKYSNSGGKIEITCSRSEKELRLSVKDYGIGIPEEHQPRVFERFYRVDKARSRELGGTGLGLAIVKHIMEIHGGRVELESAAGQGAKFTLVFPLQ